MTIQTAQFSAWQLAAGSQVDTQNPEKLLGALENIVLDPNNMI